MTTIRAHALRWVPLLLASLPFAAQGVPATPAASTESAPSVAHPAPPPASAFGALPQVLDADLSPDGTLVAIAEPAGDSSRVVIVDLATGLPRRSLPVGDLKFRRLVWADSATLLVEVSRTDQIPMERNSRTEWFRFVAVDAVGREPGRLLLNRGGERSWVTGSELVAARGATPGTVLMSTFDFIEAAYRQQTGSKIATGRAESGWVHVLYEVDPRTGRERALAFGNSFTDRFLADREGRPFASGEWEPARREYRIVGEGAKRGVLHRFRDGIRPWLVGPSADGSAVLALNADGGPRTKLWAYPLDGSAPRVVHEDPVDDVEAVILDLRRNVAQGVRLGGLEPRTHWLEPEAAALHARLERTFRGRRIDRATVSEDGRRVLARVETASTPPVWYLVDFTTRRADIVGEAHPALAEARLGAVQALTYRARDGATIPAYLTLPPGAAPTATPDATGAPAATAVPARPLPLVVLPHGGPESRDEPGFDWFAQFLATRGYAVLQPQFRGSTGFGEAHRLAGYRQWGARMQDDVTDGVRAMIERGVADPARVCIVGASYGGYAALAGATLTPELYACAVSINGVADLPQMLGHVQVRGGDESDALHYWREHIGVATDPTLAQRSPARLADRVRAPVLLIHAKDDTVVPIQQSESMARALQRAGRAHEFVALDGEDHWLSRGATRTRVLEETARFLEARLGGAR